MWGGNRIWYRRKKRRQRKGGGEAEDKYLSSFLRKRKKFLSGRGNEKQRTLQMWVLDNPSIFASPISGHAYLEMWVLCGYLGSTRVLRAWTVLRGFKAVAGDGIEKWLKTIGSWSGSHATGQRTVLVMKRMSEVHGWFQKQRPWDVTTFQELALLLIYLNVIGATHTWKETYKKAV